MDGKSSTKHAEAVAPAPAPATTGDSPPAGTKASRRESYKQSGTATVLLLLLLLLLLLSCLLLLGPRVTYPRAKEREGQHNQNPNNNTPGPLVRWALVCVCDPPPYPARPCSRLLPHRRQSVFPGAERWPTVNVLQ